MANFEAQPYVICKEWIAMQLKANKSWDEIKKCCCQSDSEFRVELERRIIESMWPDELTPDLWLEFVLSLEEKNIPIKVMYGIDNEGPLNKHRVPVGSISAWANYKKYLLEEADISDDSVAEIEKSCHWILNHLSKETRTSGPIKGLVAGSVQSGKTANMTGVISMAADYDWNFFIILSGSIDNLRKQTQGRFKRDLQNSEGISWQVIDFTTEHKYMLANDLKFNTTTESTYGRRYVTVCLKNPTRLKNLLEWLHSDPAKSSRMRMVIIDDEADQASINTADITPEEEQERTTINRLVVNLSNGWTLEGDKPEFPIQAVNYISYTATPYANVLNESSQESLYPRDFICVLPESNEYFGAKVIFGNDEEDGCDGLDIIRTIPNNEINAIKAVHSGRSFAIPESFENSLCWFLCVAAVLRKNNNKKPISMLVHTTAIQAHHFMIYQALREWFKSSNEYVLNKCQTIYAAEIARFTVDKLQDAFPNYGLMDSVITDFLDYDQLTSDIIFLKDHIHNILLDEDSSLLYKDGIHLCVDNCIANREAEEGTFLRLVYPDRATLNSLEKAPVFIVIGGNTLSRGLTIEGLACTFFSRNSMQADTLMQMARWFGYRKGYELLQRIWITKQVQEKFDTLVKIDMSLKKEIQLFMDNDIKPAQFGPRIRNTPEITKLRVTAKNRSQMAVEGDFDFCGDSYETTDFDEMTLAGNLALTETFLRAIDEPEYSEDGKALIWRGVKYARICDEYLRKYSYSAYSPLTRNMPYFFEWMSKLCSEGKFINWNIAVVGDNDQSTSRWEPSLGKPVGYITRTKKRAIETHIDIGSLRSGPDVLCDIIASSLSPDDRIEFINTKKKRTNLIQARTRFGMDETPLLLIYRISKSQGNEGANRVIINSAYDVIGFSIIVPGNNIGSNHARSLQIRIITEE